MANDATIEHAVREFLNDNFPLSSQSGELGKDDSLIAAGVIDSTGVLELIEFLEERYGIAIADDEVLPENLDSIGSIERFVSSKLGTTTDVAADAGV